jgi:hypothetical protein
MPAIIFLTTGLLNSDDTLWSCRIHSALAQTKRPSFVWDGFFHRLSTAKQRAQASSLLRTRLKDFSGPVLAPKVREILIALGDDPTRPIEPGSPFRMLSYDAIDEMSASGLIEFGAHTHTHAILSRLAPEERHREIQASVRAVAALTKRQCDFFAYPNGSEQDYDEDTIDIVRACGIRAATTTRSGPNGAHSSLMELTRYGFGAGDSATDFEMAVHHFKHYLKHSFTPWNRKSSGQVRVEGAFR